MRRNPAQVMPDDRPILLRGAGRARRSPGSHADSRAAPRRRGPWRGPPCRRSGDRSSPRSPRTGGARPRPSRQLPLREGRSAAASGIPAGACSAWSHPRPSTGRTFLTTETRVLCTDTAARRSSAATGGSSGQGAQRSGSPGCARSAGRRPARARRAPRGDGSTLPQHRVVEEARRTAPAVLECRATRIGRARSSCCPRRRRQRGEAAATSRGLDPRR